AWITINLPNAQVKVHPQSVVDYSLKAETPITIRPDGNGFFTQWAGTYVDWDETAQDGDSSFVSTTSGLQRESSSLQNPTPATWEIAGVRVVVYARYATGGMDELLTPTLVFGSRWERAAPQSFSLTTSYAEYSYTWGVNPYTEALWTWADITNLHAGVLSESVGGWSG
ncbi:MAG: hypothetical protein GTO14_11570, partial [Anaerolineales bacterium]|nr:hypothetical protein [Anaerolineales bacterium]